LPSAAHYAPASPEVSSPTETVNVLILVTGATGFLGSNIARGLAHAGHRVRALARPGSSLDLLAGLPIQVVQGDVLVPATLEAALGGVDAVVHAAAQMRGGRSLDERMASHVLGTRNVLAGARHAGVGRFVHISSVAALGIPDEPLAPTDTSAMPMDETHAWNAPPDLWPYGYAKHQAELEVRSAVAAGLDAVVVNPSIVLGAGDRKLVSNALIWHAARGRVPPIIPGGVGVVHIEDVVEGTLAALQRGRAGERYILNGENLSVEQLVTLVTEAVGLPPPRVRLSLRTARALARGADILTRLVQPDARPVLLELAGRYFYYDTRRARAELRVALSRTAAAGAGQALQWYRETSGQGSGVSGQ
jgi:dihydroflavonol-4-reductase